MQLPVLHSVFKVAKNLGMTATGCQGVKLKVQRNAQVKTRNNMSRIKNAQNCAKALFAFRRRPDLVVGIPVNLAKSRFAPCFTHFIMFAPVRKRCKLRQHYHS